MLISSTCWATQQQPTSTSSSHSSAGAAALSGSSSNSTGGSTEFHDRLQIPATPSAIAPSVSQYDPCPILTPMSSAHSILIYSESKTLPPELNAICLAYHLKQFDLVQVLGCNLNKSYREAAMGLGYDCSTGSKK